jgi:hypothetical protein
MIGLNDVEGGCSFGRMAMAKGLIRGSGTTRYAVSSVWYLWAVTTCCDGGVDGAGVGRLTRVAEWAIHTHKAIAV